MAAVKITVLFRTTIAVLVALSSILVSNTFMLIGELVLDCTPDTKKFLPSERTELTFWGKCHLVYKTPLFQIKMPIFCQFLSWVKR